MSEEAKPDQPELGEEDQIMRDLIEYVAEALVDQPDKVKVKVISGGNSCILELHVARDDVGKVIGKGGQTAKALRKILSASATKLGKKAHLEIIE